MLSDVSRSTTVFTTERETLQQAKTDQDDRSRDADGGCVWKQADDESRQTHDDDGDKEGVFAADDVADAAEHDRAERAHKEARGERE